VKGRYDRHSKTRTRDAMMATLYRCGFSIAEVARRMMRSPGCVEKVLHRLRVEMRRQGSPRNDIRDSLITLGYVCEQRSIPELARDFDVDRNTVYRALKRRRVDLRPKASNARAPFVKSRKQLSLAISHDSIGV
jgi:DNA-directed RNA polymerase specialized sigma24 family protein